MIFTKIEKPIIPQPSIFLILKKPINSQPMIFSKSEFQPIKKNLNRLKKKPMNSTIVDMCIFMDVPIHKRAVRAFYIYKIGRSPVHRWLTMKFSADLSDF